MTKLDLIPVSDRTSEWLQHCARRAYAAVRGTPQAEAIFGASNIPALERDYLGQHTGPCARKTRNRETYP